MGLEVQEECLQDWEIDELESLFEMFYKVNALLVKQD